MCKILLYGRAAPRPVASTRLTCTQKRDNRRKVSISGGRRRVGRAIVHFLLFYHCLGARNSKKKKKRDGGERVFFIIIFLPVHKTTVKKSPLFFTRGTKRSPTKCFVVFVWSYPTTTVHVRTTLVAHTHVSTPSDDGVKIPNTQARQLECPPAQNFPPRIRNVYGQLLLLY